MRFIHTADWHLGRYFHGVHLTEDQRQLLLGEILPLVKESNVEAVVIAGDIYDRGVPPVEAVDLFNEVLTKLVEQRVKVLYIAGNHDSAARIGFGSQLFARSGVYVRGELTADLAPVVLEDAYGPVAFQLFPYMDPASVSNVFPKEDEAAPRMSYAAAHRFVIERARKVLPHGCRSVAVAHAFLAGGQESDSERPLAVGGSGNVPPAVFAGYNYTALGHLHNPQAVGRAQVRYSGSLMKYSFNEAQTDKSVSIVELDGAGEVQLEQVALHPRRDVRRIRGAFADILQDEQAYPASQDYLEIELTDQRRILGVQDQLREKFPNFMHVSWAGLSEAAEDRPVTYHGRTAQSQSDAELFGQFYEQMTGRALAAEEQAVLASCLKEIQQEARENR
ncbi:MAG: exonuclease SbcCD subunit D [Selenomonadaceae bacterium]|nr:exonuclease SbcCD subunit D [Selenomonadaceae bacterium]